MTVLRKLFGCFALFATAGVGAPADADRIHLDGENFERVISRKTGATIELSAGQKTLFAGGEEFRIVANGHDFVMRDFRVAEIQPGPQKVIVTLRNRDIEVDLEYWTSPRGYLRKRLRLRVRKELTLERVDVESLQISTGVNVAVPRGSRNSRGLGGLGEFPICAFAATDTAGAFLSLDFAISKIESSKGLLRVGYEPHIKLRSGEEYESHSVTIGAYRLAGERQGPYDKGAANAFRRYIRFDYAPPHLKGPQLIYTSIVNRHTEIDRLLPPTKMGETPFANTIFYTLSNANYYMLRPDKIPAEIDFCKSLGMEICQLYEGPFAWTPGNPAASVARQIGEYARDRGVKLGLFTAANHLTAAHFDHYAQDKGRPGWRMLVKDGKRGAYCWGSDEFADWFADLVIETSLNYNFRMANLDFLDITPCYDGSHGHAIGEEGIYHQVFNLVRTLENIRTSVPGYSYDSNLGWPPFVPKVAKWMDAFYLNDPHFSVYFPSLNTTEVLDNSRRYEMVSYYLKYLTPVEYFRNCEYFISGDSVLHDSQIFEYGILQGLAITPNLQLGEARALFDRLRPDDQDRARRFLSRWTSFVKANFDYYANTIFLTGLPRLGQVEIYAHAKEDRSLVFLVNPNPFPRDVSFRLDQTIGLQRKGPYLVHELYPEDRLLSGTEGFEASAGEQFEGEVPARTVIVLEVSVATGYSNPPLRIAGAPASYDRFPDHYRIRVEGEQGELRTLELFLPSNESLVRVESRGRVLPAKPVVGGHAVSVAFPKERVQPNVLKWTASPVSLEEGMNASLWRSPPDRDPIDFPQLESDASGANFLGARVENLLNERFSRELLIYFDEGKMDEESAVVVSVPQQSDQTEAKAEVVLSHEGTEWWYTARIPIAYVQTYIRPAPDQHNYIALNFKNPSAVTEIRAWLNGKETSVETFRHWRGPDRASNYYIDGTDSGLKRGANILSMFVRYGDGQ